MVTKSRTVMPALVPFGRDGSVFGSYPVGRKYEAMSDSSVTGSARTDVDAVDRFLANPSNHGDFMLALRESNLSAGDAGLHGFRVDREQWRASTTSATVPYSGINGWVDRNWFGFRMRTPDPSAFPVIEPFVEPSPAKLANDGQKLFTRALPMQSQAELGTALMEAVSNPVRALALPVKAVRGTGTAIALSGSLLKKQVRIRHRAIAGLPLEQARLAADDYLTYIFGVRPTVQDLDDLAGVISRSRRSAETVSRMREKRIRRRRVLPTKERVGTATSGPGFTFMFPTGNQIGLYGTTNYFTTTTSQTWWSGSFRMVTSDTDDWLSRCNDLFLHMDRITGLGLDVRVAWDLIPFSFMVDWFANTGDFLSNRQVIADYNIACEYGYVMNHTRLQKVAVASGRFQQAYPGAKPGSTGSVSYTTEVETKLRTSAGAGGISVNFDSLNGTQLAALSALGLTSALGARPTTRS